MPLYYIPKNSLKSHLPQMDKNYVLSSRSTTLLIPVVDTSPPTNLSPIRNPNICQADSLNKQLEKSKNCLKRELAFTAEEWVIEPKIVRGRNNKSLQVQEPSNKILSPQSALPLTKLPLQLSPSR